MKREEIKIRETDGSLTIESEMFTGEPEDDISDWMVVPLDADRYLLQAKKSGNFSSENSGLASCDSEVFANLIFGFNQRRWSGTVSVDTGNGMKKLYFREGEICFARSNIIDDRLGEVIYRTDGISLDQLAQSAVQVTREIKFGQVLLRSGIFNTVDLWNALQWQVRDIVRSVFLVSRVFFEIETDGEPAPTEVVFPEGTRSLINESYSFGCMYREFLTRITPESTIKIKNQDDLGKAYAPGSFIGDLLELIKANPTVGSVVESSKLTELNTFVALLSLVNRGYCSVSVPKKAETAAPPEGLGPLKAKLDAYAILVSVVKQKFVEEKIGFPANDLRKFALNLNSPGFLSLYLNEAGELDRESRVSMYSQCRDSAERIEYFVIRLESLIQFLLQVSGDLLPYKTAKNVRVEYRSMVK
ncbi:MAG: hypothetical protein SGJ20_19335 [Planctomycetota bacterium]|nr:hypothetical protein [Planctomycetota bacterium]